VFGFGNDLKQYFLSLCRKINDTCQMQIMQIYHNAHHSDILLI